MPILLASFLCLTALSAEDRPTVIIVVGAPGSADYEPEFRRWADLWQAASSKAGADSIRIGEAKDDPASTGNDRDRLRSALAEHASGTAPLWLVLIGHGSFDGREAKFNLRGPDVSEVELAGWLESVKRPIAVLDCSSSSGPFLSKLSGEGRVVVAATRSGNESNFARFGQYLAESIADPRADLDKDGQVSLLEAYLAASSRTEEFYKSKSRLSTEHALLDDNGDKLGTPADWFRGVRATKRAKDGAPADGLRAHQWHLVPSDRERALPPEVRRDRDRIELAIAALRDEKPRLAEDDYYARLEALMVELARLYGGHLRASAGP
ncbi:hypothetical protein P12x_002801 [Tundrisphaera lichenicola]|uniref:hypothetical protein n=1 Tax=Tundrisphaera lichenicola TaxID=2029860 RepID=UPI003EC13E38